MSTPIHYVTVDAGTPDQDGDWPDPTITFECRDPQADCHTYPDCACESWDKNHEEEYGEGHENIHHEECWVQSWFDVGGAEYDGDDFDDTFDYGFPRGVNRSGPIEATFDGDYVVWHFTESEDQA